jgi:hypothetical protein
MAIAPVETLEATRDAEEQADCPRLFERFKKLPPELRFAIWRLVFQEEIKDRKARLVLLNCHQRNLVVPTLYRTCHESRDQVRTKFKIFKRDLPTRGPPRPRSFELVDLAIDTLRFLGYTGDARLENKMLKAFLNKCTHDNITKIAIMEETFRKILNLPFYQKALDGIVKKGSLKTVIVVFQASAEGPLIHPEKEEVHLFSCAKYRKHTNEYERSLNKCGEKRGWKFRGEIRAMSLESTTLAKRWDP